MHFFKCCCSLGQQKNKERYGNNLLGFCFFLLFMMRWNQSHSSTYISSFKTYDLRHLYSGKHRLRLMFFFFNYSWRTAERVNALVAEGKRRRKELMNRLIYALSICVFRSFVCKLTQIQTSIHIQPRKRLYKSLLPRMIAEKIQRLYS